MSAALRALNASSLATQLTRDALARSASQEAEQLIATLNQAGAHVRAQVLRCSAGRGNGLSVIA